MSETEAEWFEAMLQYLQFGAEDERIEAMKQIWISLSKKGSQVALGRADDLMGQLMNQIDISFGPYGDDEPLVLRPKLCKYALNTVLEVFKQVDLALEMHDSTLEKLMKALLLRLLDKRLRTEEHRNLVKGLNMLMLKVLENVDRTTSCHILLKFLREGLKAQPPSRSFLDLTIKCLLKLVRKLSEFVDELNLQFVLRDIHNFLVENPPNSTQVYDMPLKSVRTTLSELAKIRAAALIPLMHTLPASSPAVAYLERFIASYHGEDFMASHGWAGQASPPASLSLTSATSSSSSYAPPPYADVASDEREDEFQQSYSESVGYEQEMPTYRALPQRPVSPTLDSSSSSASLPSSSAASSSSSSVPPPTSYRARLAQLMQGRHPQQAHSSQLQAQFSQLQSQFEAINESMSSNSLSRSAAAALTAEREREREREAERERDGQREREALNRSYGGFDTKRENESNVLSQTFSGPSSSSSSLSSMAAAAHADLTARLKQLGLSLSSTASSSSATSSSSSARTTSAAADESDYGAASSHHRASPPTSPSVMDERRRGLNVDPSLPASQASALSSGRSRVLQPPSPSHSSSNSRSASPSPSNSRDDPAVTDFRSRLAAVRKPLDRE